MSNTSTAGIEEIIRLRRSVKPENMNGRKIPDDEVLELIGLADWAPTHARTEPWRFIVFSGDKTAAFARKHADLFRAHTPEASFTQMKYDNIERMGNKVSHVIIAWMKRIPNHKIPEIEEISATAASIENLLLAATSRGIVSFWSTGGMTHHPAFKDAFGIGEEDRVLGILYLGHSDEQPAEGKRSVPLSEKIEWVR